MTRIDRPRGLGAAQDDAPHLEICSGAYLSTLGFCFELLGGHLQLVGVFGFERIMVAVSRRDDDDQYGPSPCAILNLTPRALGDAPVAMIDLVGMAQETAGAAAADIHLGGNRRRGPVHQIAVLPVALGDDAGVVVAANGTGH